MDVLGVNGNWLGAGGLVIDMVGVALLTFDLAPEFVLSREKQRFTSTCRDLGVRLADASFSDAATTQPGQQWVVDGTIEGLYGGDAESVLGIPIDPFAPVLLPLTRLMAPRYREGLLQELFQSSNVLAGLASAAPRWVLARWRWLAPPTIDPVKVWVWLQHLAGEINRAERVVAERKRPPFWVAGLAIVLGFALQLLGTIPL